MKFDNLLAVTVTTASKVDEMISDVPGVLSVITRGEFRYFGNSFLKDVLLHIPNIRMSANFMTD